MKGPCPCHQTALFPARSSAVMPVVDPGAVAGVVAVASEAVVVFEPVLLAAEVVDFVLVAVLVVSTVVSP